MLLSGLIIHHRLLDWRPKILSVLCRNLAGPGDILGAGAAHNLFSLLHLILTGRVGRKEAFSFGHMTFIARRVGAGLYDGCLGDAGFGVAFRLDLVSKI